MTPEEVEARRQLEVQRLNESEARVLGYAVLGAEGSYELLCRIRRSRERLLGTGPAIQVRVSVPEGATPEQKRKAIAAATAKRLKELEEQDD